MNTYQGEGTSIISIKFNHQSIFFVCFKQRFPFSHVLRLFQDNLIFGEATSSHFSRVTTSTQQLHFRSTYFSEQLLFSPFSEQSLFRSSCFFRLASFSERKFYRAASQDKDIYKRTAFLKEVPLHSINFFRKATFLEKLIFQKSNNTHYLLFLDSCLFRAATVSKDATFYSTYLFL